MVASIVARDSYTKASRGVWKAGTSSIFCIPEALAGECRGTLPARRRAESVWRSWDFSSPAQAVRSGSLMGGVDAQPDKAFSELLKTETSHSSGFFSGPPRTGLHPWSGSKSHFQCTQKDTFIPKLL
jgi:hypothetical protein